MMKGEDYNDVLRRDPNAILRMVDQAVLRRRLNGSAEQENDPPNEPEEHKKRAKIELPNDFTPESEMRPAAPPQLIKKTLPSRGTGLGIGQSGAGKTAVHIDMACAVASGTPFFEREVRHQGGVVYIAVEGAGGLNNRIKAAKIHRGIHRAIPLLGKAGSCNLKDDNELAALIADLKQADAWFQQEFGVPLRLTIIDTMSAACALQNENDNAEIADVCKRLQRIDAETGAFCLGIHHAGKNQEAGARGASAWRANVDNVFACAADRSELTGKCENRCLYLSKYRDGPEGFISGYDFKFIELGKDEDGEPFSAPAIIPTDSGSAELKKKPTKSQRVFDAAFNEAALEHGEQIQVRGDGPTVKSVDVQRVQHEFSRRWGTGEADKDKRQDATRKAFKRCLQNIEGRYGLEQTADMAALAKVARTNRTFSDMSTASTQKGPDGQDISFRNVHVRLVRGTVVKERGGVKERNLLFSRPLQIKCERKGV